MFRWVLLLSFLVVIPASHANGQAPAATAPVSPAAFAAKQTFDTMTAQWADLYVKLAEKSKQKSTGSANKKLDQEIKVLGAQIEGMVDKIVEAGLAAHRAGLKNDATINSTLIAIAGFYVTGDEQGDGGDQYEKALPLIKSMLSAGLGETSKELWLWGGVSAFNLNDFDLAAKYFRSAELAGYMGQRPPSQDRAAPINRVWQLAMKQKNDLAATRRAWKKEQSIRAQEATANNLPRVKLQTSRGVVIIELFEDQAPQAVASFINLVKSGFYDGVVFHRVLPAFMAQGGDPTGSGSGGPGYNIRCECYGPNIRKHFRGSLSMAHAGRDTGGSQFFLTFVPTSYLDGRHTVFGRVIEGMEAAAALKRRDPSSPGRKPEPDRIVKAEVLRDRGHEYKFEKLPAR